MATLTRSLVGALTFLAVVAGPAAPATTPAQKCAAAKQKTAGKKVAGKMACHSKAKAKSVAVDPNCLTKAEAKFNSAMTKAGNACPGAASPIETLADNCVTILVGDDPGNGKCPSSSAKAAGK